MNERQAHAHAWKVGDLVLYSPSVGYYFGAVVDSHIERFGEHRTVRLKGLGSAYWAYKGREICTTSAAACGRLRHAPTEYVDGRWVVPGEAEPEAVVTYASEPSPETGHVGWMWWALGKMGDAASYEDARRIAEGHLRAAKERAS